MRAFPFLLRFFFLKYIHICICLSEPTSLSSRSSLDLRLATLRQWRQLAVVANIFGTKYVDEGRPAKALEMLKKAESLAEMEFGWISPEDMDRSGEFTRASRLELKAFVHDSMAYYYYKRLKPSAALQYVQRAIRIHRRLEQYEVRSFVRLIVCVCVCVCVCVVRERERWRE